MYQLVPDAIGEAGYPQKTLEIRKAGLLTRRVGRSLLSHERTKVLVDLGLDSDNAQAIRISAKGHYICVRGGVAALKRRLPLWYGSEKLKAHQCFIPRRVKDPGNLCWNPVPSRFPTVRGIHCSGTLLPMKH